MSDVWILGGYPFKSPNDLESRSKVSKGFFSGESTRHCEIHLGSQSDGDSRGLQVEGQHRALSPPRLNIAQIHMAG